MKREENVPLSSITTFKTGGPARFVCVAETEDEVKEAVLFAKGAGLPLVPLGEGSNLCAPDEGVEAVFLKVAMKNFSFQITGENVYLSAESGLSWDSLAADSIERGWWGIENLSGIPGSVGASVVQNIGAYGAALSDVVYAVDAFDTKERQTKTFTREECEFGYRTSIFKKECDRYVIVRIVLQLSKTPKPNLEYRDLKNKFDQAIPTLADIRNAVLEIRKGKFPSLSEFGTAGSFFLNPIISESERARVTKLFPEMPLFDMPEGGVKIPLAWIFDHVLTLKGMREGKAFVWDKQPLVIAAESGALSKDIYTLAATIARMTKEKTGIEIIPEVRLFGAENNFFRV